MTSNVNKENTEPLMSALWRKVNQGRGSGSVSYEAGLQSRTGCLKTYVYKLNFTNIFDNDFK